MTDGPIDHVPTARARDALAFNWSTERKSIAETQASYSSRSAGVPRSTPVGELFESGLDVRVR